MRIVIQRVNSCSLSINGAVYSRIGIGLLVLLGIEDADTAEDIEWLCGKVSKLRVFDDPDGVMNLSLQDINGELMIVSQFTLHASTRKGNRPSYIRAARPETAAPLYESFISQMETFLGKKPATGVFGAMMDISLVNSGPVTILMDSKNRE